MLVIIGNKAIEVEDFNYQTHTYDITSGKIIELSYNEKQQWTTLKAQQEQERIEGDKKKARAVYLDAYRKYQAAVNYGQFERVPAVDAFIAALRNKDWTALNNVPPQIKYFTGEVSLAQSGLIPKTA